MMVLGDAGTVNREQRVVAVCRVEFVRLDEVVVAQSEDLSRRGVFVRTEELLPVGDVVELLIGLPKGDEFRVIARVAHLLSPTAARALGRRPGMGFEFLDQNTEGRAQLEHYLEGLIDEATPTPTPVLHNVRVLVADENPRLRERLVNALSEEGFSVQTAPNGSEAYSAALESPPDIIVASCEMPVMDGWTLLSMVSNRASLRDIGVVLMSDDASDMTRLRAYRGGVRDFLQAPFTDEELCIRMRRVAVVERGPDKVVLRGHLDEIGVPTLLSLLEFERKSGILALLSDDRAARLFVAAGRVVKVEGPESGEPLDLLLGILGWADGSFEFAACEVVGGDEVGMATQPLLLEHARRLDEAERS